MQLLLLPATASQSGVLDQTTALGLGPLAPVPQIVGGLVFGVGMALAGGCITGILWKTGAGSVVLLLAVAGFAAGELLARGPFDGALADLVAAGPQRARATVPALLDVGYTPVALVAGVVVLALLLRRSRAGLVFGAALGVIAVLAWIAADRAGYGYGLGFVGAPDSVRAAIDARSLSGGGLLPAWVALGVIAGAFALTRPPLRVPSLARAARAAGGGVLMGVGGNVAGGCNIGLGLTGLPLLQTGSALAIAAMAAGALATWALLLRPLPALRGTERPPPAPVW